MNNWTNNNLQMGQASFTPYNNFPSFNPYQQSNRLPTYTATPINGENAAWQFPMGPNSEIWLPDANEDVIWWIRTDVHGNKTVMDFDVQPRQKKPQVDTNDLAARLAAVEEWINAKSNKSNAKRNTTTVAAANTATATTIE